MAALSTITKLNHFTIFLDTKRKLNGKAFSWLTLRNPTTELGDSKQMSVLG